jgi:CxxC motif-containing protein (DUF1111 family)
MRRGSRTRNVRYLPMADDLPPYRTTCFGTLSLALTLAGGACSSDTSDKPNLDGIKVVHEDLGDSPLPKLPDEWQARFNMGDTLFDRPFYDAQGLGPVFIRSACGACHGQDQRGPGTVRKMVLIGGDGVPLPDQSALAYGHTIRPQTSMGVSDAIDAPDDTSDLLITVRMPPAVIGRGYLEAIEDEEIQRVAAEQAQGDDGVSGRINWVTYASQLNTDTRFHTHAFGERLIGRFGLKARIATLDDFTADALQGDMGITSNMRPDELPNPNGDVDAFPGVDTSDDTVNLMADYMRMLRIPARAQDASGSGAELFEEAQCSVCHVPTLHTQADYALPALADIDAPVYSDLLLHDMGAAFNDGLNDYDAGGSEWRTAPLLGLRFQRNYLHDGRASTIEQAIEAHGGDDSEAARAVQRFRDLDETSRAQLLAFVSAL